MAHSRIVHHHKNAPEIDYSKLEDLGDEEVKSVLMKNIIQHSEGYNVGRHRNRALQKEIDRHIEMTDKEILKPISGRRKIMQRLKQKLEARQGKST